MSILPSVLPGVLPNVLLSFLLSFLLRLYLGYETYYFRVFGILVDYDIKGRINTERLTLFLNGCLVCCVGISVPTIIPASSSALMNLVRGRPGSQRSEYAAGFKSSSLLGERPLMMLALIWMLKIQILRNDYSSATSSPPGVES